MAHGKLWGLSSVGHVCLELGIGVIRMRGGGWGWCDPHLDARFLSFGKELLFNVLIFNVFVVSNKDIWVVCPEVLVDVEEGFAFFAGHLIYLGERS